VGEASVYWRVRDNDYPISMGNGRKALTTNAQHSNARVQQALVIGMSLMLVVTLLAFGLLVVAIQQRVVEPPRFSLHIGHVYFGAPCPSPAFNCDINLNYYAVWRGQDMPDGRVHFEEVFFTYLPKKH
jgi:hypothetical protein